jgi:hypothetical protein
MFQPTRFAVAISVCLGMLVVWAQAGDYIVDPKSPKSDDKNAGTLEAPFKTIQAALDKAQPGDRVEVRAGVYHESVSFKRSGTSRDACITLEAYKDERAVVDGAADIPADQWKRVEGRKNLYWTPLETQGNRQVNIVFLGETLILPTLKNIAGANSSLIEGTPCDIMPAMPDDNPGDQGYYHDQKEKKLFVNLGGRTPGKDVDVRPVQLHTAISTTGRMYVCVRKLEIRNFITDGIWADDCIECVTEDNHIHHCGAAFWGGNITGGAIRRNTFTDLMGTGMGVGGARSTIVEENLILRWNMNPYKVVSWGGCGIICNGGRALVLRNNVIADGPDSAVWPDCCGNGITIYGNTVYHVRGDGFYIEAGVYGTILRWNTIFDSGSGITFRENFGNNAFENYVYHTSRALAIATCDQDNRPKADVMMYNWIIDNGMGAAFAPDLSNEPAHVLDHNIYKFQNWPDVDLGARKPAVSRIDKTVEVGMTSDCWPGTRLRGQLLARWTGILKVQKDGEYGLYVTTHELNGARLSVDGKPALCQGEAKVPTSSKEKEYRLTLKAGDHEIVLEFYHSLMDNLWKSCIFSWQPPGQAKAVVPENVLFHREPGAADLQPGLPAIHSSKLLAGLKAEIFDIHDDPTPVDPTNKAVILQYGNKQYKDLASIRAEVGQEIHGKVVTEFDPSTLGLATFRVHDAKKSWKPVPMIGNPLPDRFDVVNAYSPYFWKKGSFRGVEEGPWYGAGCGFGSETRADLSAFVRIYVTSCHWDVYHPFDDKTAALPGHIAYLQVGAALKKSVSAEGYGYWSPALPTTDGAQIDLSLWARLKEVKSTADNGGLFVTAEFCDITGQNVTRQYLAGGDEGQKPRAVDSMTGDYPHKKLAATVTAPKGARWFRLGFGLRSCTGWASFNDIEIQTRPGTPEAEVQRVLPIDAGRFTWTPCDLTKLFNRPLADDVDNDGKGGWTDQGPLMDLRNLQAGDYTFNHVAFRVEKGNACFIMKNKHRPSQNLPEGGKVDLKGKSDLSANNSKGTMADVLAFLHTGGWIDADVRQATYIVHYADGTKVEIPVIGGRNIIDWVQPPARAEDVKYDPALGLILPATTVASPQFVHVTVWMTLWKNPHPDKEIAALEVKGANEGIPGLIAVSRGEAKK